MLEKNVMGFEGFYWAIGVVEDRQDPLALGRVRARAYGIHTDSLADIPTDSLPWATVTEEVNLQLAEGDTVLMFFADGRSCQIPIIFAKLPKFFVNKNTPGTGFNDTRPDTTLKNAPRPPTAWSYKSDGSGIKVTSANTAARNPIPSQLGEQTLSGATRYEIANTVIQQRIDNLDKNIPCATGLTWSEPVPAYNPLYPYNKAYQSESGHIVEIDDTTGNERLAWTHRTGTFMEWYPSGSRVQKVTKSNYSITMGDDYVHIMGRCLITVGQGAYVKVIGDANIECDNDLNIGVGGDTTISTGGVFNIKARTLNLDLEGEMIIAPKGDLHLNPGGDLHAVPGGTAFITASDVEIGDGTVNISGASVNIQEGVAPGQSVNPPSITPPPAIENPTTGSAGLEPVPVPFTENFAKLNSYTGLAYKYSQFLVNGQTPDANANTVPPSQCGFDPNTHTFVSSPFAISQEGIQSIQQREGLGVLLPSGLIQAYQDPPGTQSYSIGYGVSAALLPYPVNANTTITRTQASSDFTNVLNNIFVPHLNQVVTVQLTQNMVDALISFMYNIGTGGFDQSSVLRFVNQQQWCSAFNSFKLWNKSGGVVNSGLTGRRQAEANQFIT